MRIAILSDIHGNLPALEAVFGDVKTQSPDEVWVGGDLGWAGPWARECIAQVRATGRPARVDSFAGISRSFFRYSENSLV